MADINIPESVTGLRNTAQSLASTAGAYQAAEPSVMDKLRETVTNAFASNQDIIQPLSEAEGSYYAAPSTARLKYENIFNPYQREALVSQYTATEAVPMLAYSGIYGQRTGRIEDYIGAGTRAFQAEAQYNLNKAELARQSYQDALNEYTISKDLERQSQLDALERERFELTKQSTAAEIAYTKAQTANVGKSSGGGTTPLPWQPQPQPTQMSEPKPNYKLGPVSAVSPGGQWAWNYQKNDWFPMGR